MGGPAIADVVGSYGSLPLPRAVWGGWPLLSRADRVDGDAASAMCQLMGALGSQAPLCQGGIAEVLRRVVVEACDGAVEGSLAQAERRPGQLQGRVPVIGLSSGVWDAARSASPAEPISLVALSAEAAVVKGPQAARLGSVGHIIL